MKVLKVKKVEQTRGQRELYNTDTLQGLVRTIVMSCLLGGKEFPQPRQIEDMMRQARAVDDKYENAFLTPRTGSEKGPVHLRHDIREAVFRFRKLIENKGGHDKIPQPKEVFPVE